MEVERASDLCSYVQQNGSSSNSSEGSSSVERKGVVVQQHPSRHCSCILLLFLGLSCTRSVQQCGQSLLPAAIAPTFTAAACCTAASSGSWEMAAAAAVHCHVAAAPALDGHAVSVVHSDGAARSAGMCTGMLPRECVSASRSAYEPGITAPCSSTQVMPDRLTLCP